MGGSASSNTLNESPTNEISTKIIVASVIFLFMVVLFVILLNLYSRWFWWRIEEETTAPPPRRHRRFVFAPGQDSVTSVGTQQLGLDPEILKSLPLLVFKPEEFKDGLECTVCLSEIVEGEITRLLPKCNHGFHVYCIDMWFHSHSTCPLCRNLVASESESSKDIISTSNAEENLLSNSESLEAENSSAMSDLESQSFPTNVLVWGNPNQVSTYVNCFIEEGTSEQPPNSSISTPSTSSSDDDIVNSGCHEMLMIDISSELSSSSLSPSSETRCVEDELKSPMSTKLRSFKRLLSRDKKLSTFSPASMDVEQA
ncbi:hypothetical protein TanjilG_05092 [Lupinus angustifolius]|uniref:RING-type E3 ubiquitin transferase n=1 Tax=Lupinus angustifolius TaxID=3871 RepID=A0A4P1R680_LUPAN|nr:PREDICTED: RING-H2 finger protein ATL3-like [Lupinus angustifolius]OIW02499.1 hypothetical protein TanjilG_05092 [Lupinus angustifolius]